MSEPIAPAETVEDAMRHASEQLRALKKTKPQNAAAARLHSAELVRLQQELISATHRATDAAAAKRLNGSNGAKPAGGMSGFTEKQVETLLKIMATVLRPHFDAYDKRLDELECKKEIAPLIARLVELEAHVIELEQRPTMRYEGVWDAERMYAIGDFATDDGSLWHCDKACTGVRPPASCWTLAVKRGKDGKVR